ncbi:fluoride efflux transporter CrcB [Filibacter tadaridae]|uniref:Fluoride-specific ion channel FluC n=1 Tax=Filibacter tadaridae TaxID=2483811 RepID=A0A3P5XAR7_9BACL|nr:fluoride efflux transporter CrcB [Filibacter tadaridae]VDC25519.1 Putative fluoride ion transporter CrcB [Filibacter tadaridae]
MKKINGAEVIRNRQLTKRLLWIGLGGAVGAILRTLIGESVQHAGGIPVATLFVNIIGTFLLCFIVSGSLRMLLAHKELTNAITTGFLGSFTTFSTLSIELVELMENGQFVLAVIYISISIIGGLSLGVLGFHLGGKKVRG